MNWPTAGRFDARARYGALNRPYNNTLVPERRVPSYVDLTMVLGWRVNQSFELALIGAGSLQPPARVRARKRTWRHPRTAQRAQGTLKF
jgi:hypothetical protein